MHVKVSRQAMAIKFEVMMLQVGKTVRHIVFPGFDRLLPDLRTVALDTHFAGTAPKSPPTTSSGPMLHSRNFDPARFK